MCSLRNFNLNQMLNIPAGWQIRPKSVWIGAAQQKAGLNPALWS
jgi:hypothetical protein